MPSSRKMLAAESEKAAMLSEIALKHGFTLYSYTNSLIEAALLIDNSGYTDPREAATDIIIMKSLLATGFSLCPPNIKGSEEWETLGETLGHLIRQKMGKVNILRILYSMFSLLLGQTNVFFQDQDGSLSLIIALPPDKSINADVSESLVRGILKILDTRKEARIERKSNIILVKKTVKPQNTTTRKQ